MLVGELRDPDDGQRVEPGGVSQDLPQVLVVGLFELVLDDHPDRPRRSWRRCRVTADAHFRASSSSSPNLAPSCLRFSGLASHGVKSPGSSSQMSFRSTVQPGKILRLVTHPLACRLGAGAQSCIARQTFSGVSGVSRCSTPKGRSASITALTTAGVEPMVAASPIPLTPSGFTGVGVTVRCSS